MLSQASKSGFQLFTVGVGSSVSEAFVQTLAEVTGGACEAELNGLLQRKPQRVF